MGITYKIDAVAGVMFTVAEGEIGAAEIRDARERFTADPSYADNLAQLHDGRAANFSFSGEEAQIMGIWSKQNRPTEKSALVINKEAQGFARMFIAWGSETQRIFHDMASAREWLGLPAEDDS